MEDKKDDIIKEQPLRYGLICLYVFLDNLFKSQICGKLDNVSFKVSKLSKCQVSWHLAIKLTYCVNICDKCQEI